MNSWNCFTKEEALQKLCQESFNRLHEKLETGDPRGGPMYCKADLCMAWKWYNAHKSNGYCGKAAE